MNTEIIARDLPIFIGNRFLENGVVFLAKFSLYLIITRPFPTKRYPGIIYILENLFYPLKNRRHIMKSFQYLFMSFFILFVATGCYTTFYSVKHTSAADGGYYVENGYYAEELADDYTDEYIEETTLSYRPSRLVIEKTYFDYGHYVRKVKYVAYDYDPWYDPYPVVYYDDPIIYINFHFGFGFYHPYRPWHPYPGVYIAGGWFDPWWCHPVHYPIYYPVPIYYPYPVYYDPPHYTHHPYRNYQKRDWDRRTSTDNRRFASGGKRGEYNSYGRSYNELNRNSKDKSTASTKGIRTSTTIPQDQNKPSGSRESARRNTDNDRGIVTRTTTQQVQPRITRSNILKKFGEDTRIINTTPRNRNDNDNKQSDYSNSRNQSGAKKSNEGSNNPLVQPSSKSQASSNSAPRRITSTSQRKSNSQDSKYNSSSSNQSNKASRSPSVKSNKSTSSNSKSYSQKSSGQKSTSRNTSRSSSGSSRSNSDTQQKSSRGRR
jgi:hypothetical protein